MFIGHFGIGLAAKGIDRKTSLGTHLMAANFIDLVWPFFLLFGLETIHIKLGGSNDKAFGFIYSPFSRSLAAVMVWAVLLGGFYFLLKKRLLSAMVIYLLVISHWILDFALKLDNSRILPWMETKVSAGLWNSVGLTIIIEIVIFIIGAGIYIHKTHSRNETGVIGIWSLLIFLIALYLLNVLGPAPSQNEPVEYLGMAQWLLILWAYWADKLRSSSKHIQPDDFL